MSDEKQYPNLAKIVPPDTRMPVTNFMDALEAVLDLHQPRTIYGHEDMCDNEDDHHIQFRHFETEFGEWMCRDIDTDESLCASCLDGDGWASSWPCDTWTAITEKLEGKDDRG